MFNHGKYRKRFSIHKDIYLAIFDFDSKEFDSNDSDIRSLAKGEKLKLLHKNEEDGWVQVYFFDSDKSTGCMAIGCSHVLTFF